jgi:hypothetical protein
MREAPTSLLLAHDRRYGPAYAATKLLMTRTHISDNL